jgi:hypothetical protein
MFTRFEARHQPLISTRRFLLRMAAFGAVALGFDLVLIVIGAVGFHQLGDMGWLDAMLDAAMILTGNGPIHPAASAAIKLFQLVFAVAGGIGFVIVVTVVLAPVVHRVLHSFHLEPQDAAPPAEPPGRAAAEDTAPR